MSWAYSYIKLFRKEHVAGADWSFVLPCVLIALSGSVASQFGYASLSHINYPTHMLAKSCKLIPVMLTGALVYRRKYSIRKYFCVLLVTLGVTGFMFLTPHHSEQAASNSVYGLFLVVVNGILDGYTGTLLSLFIYLYLFTHLFLYGSTSAS